MRSNLLTLTEAFNESFIHDRHYILGLELDPFCIDHLMLLEALESPLIFGGRVEVQDIYAAVQICSTASPEDFFDVTLRPSFGWKLWAAWWRGMDVRNARDRFEKYMADYAPTFSQRPGDGDPAKCPGIMLTAARLVKSGIDPKKVRRMAIGEMTAWAIAILEADGDPLKNLRDDQDVMFKREQAEMEGG